jgi:uncharacterized protein (DUF58 family)
LKVTSRSGANPESLLRRLEWTVLRRLDGLLQGDYRSLFRGFDMDLADIREYEYGDDVRFIDWNVTARLSTPYVRRFDEDREISAWFILDLSPSVDFGAGDRKKIDVLVEFVAVISRLLTKHGNRVGAILYDGGAVEAIPARGGRDQVLMMLRRLMSRPRLDASPPTDLRKLLASTLDMLKRRSLIFLASDFFSEPRWTEPLSYLCLRHEVLAVRLSDPSEEELPDLGIAPMRDAESGERLMVDTHDRGFRERFAAAAMRREEELRSNLSRAGVDTLEMSTKDDLAESILRFARMRKARAALAGGGRATSNFRGRR